MFSFINDKCSRTRTGDILQTEVRNYLELSWTIFAQVNSTAEMSAKNVQKKSWITFNYQMCALYKEFSYNFRINFVQPWQGKKEKNTDVLMTGMHRTIIEKWLPRDMRIGKNLYRASVHGFEASKFHEKCDNKVSFHQNFDY